MKFTILTFALLVNAISVFSQVANSHTLITDLANCKADNGKLQQENDYLKKSLNILQPIKVFKSDGLEFNLLKADGNIKEQTVTFTFALTNRKANNDFQFASAQAIDIQGNDFKASNINIGQQGKRNKLYTDTPIKTIIEIRQVLPSTKIFKVLNAEYTVLEFLKKDLLSLRI
jgi:hypothetical protein